MVRTTRKQREALKQLFSNNPLYSRPGGWARSTPLWSTQSPMCYREFRKLIQPSLDGSGCVMVPWCGMWIGIETDGYTHS